MSDTETTTVEMSEEELLAKEQAEYEEYEKTLQKQREVLAQIQEYDPDFKPHEFDGTFAEFFMQNPFFGALSLEVTKVIDHKQPTAYVGVRLNGRSHEIIMGLNPKFFRTMTQKQRFGVLKHELYHFVFQHIFSRAVGDSSYAMMWNWATDLAINSIVGKDNLPEMCLIPGQRPLKPAEMKDSNGKPIIDPKTGKPKLDPKKLEPADGPYADFIEKAPPGQSSDYYFEELRKIQEQQGDQDNQIAVGSGIGTMDDHDQWKNLPPEVQEQIRDKVREMVGKGVQKADRDNSWGDIPAEIQEQIRRMVSREIDWRTVVKNFIGRTRSLLRNSTVRKINKKMPYIHPGVKRPLIATFACFIDQSGSMSDEDIAMLFGELENFAQETTLDVYHFDTEIDENSHTVWKKGTQFPKAHRTRCGGTDFQSVANFVNRNDNRNRWSGIVILTDGYAPVMGQIIGSKVLWVITEHGTMETVRPGDLAVKMKQAKQFKNY
jgi:predicted metal-dependent peptidase